MIASETSKSTYNGNGATTVFARLFPVSDKTHVRVVLTDADGVEHEQVVDTDYTVQGVSNPSSGTWTITMVTAPATGETLTILPGVPLTQETDFENQGGFFAKTHENSFDRLTLIAQQLQEQLDRCLKAGVGTDINPEDLITSVVASAAAAETAAENAEAAAEEVGTALIPEWLTATAYTVGRTVVESNKIYRCATNHTSGTFATDLAASRWVYLGVSAWADITGKPSKFDPLLRNQQVFTASGTFTVPAGITEVDVEVLSAGGGGGGVSGTSNRVAGGGAGGSYARARVTGLTPGANIAVTVGTGGTGASAGAGAGNAGGSSSFGAHLSCAGGGAGRTEAINFQESEAPGAVTGSSYIEVLGVRGFGSSTANGAYSKGGDSFYGRGPLNLDAAGENGNAGTSPGAGGGGGCNGTGTTARAGGNGANGLVIVRW